MGSQGRKASSSIDLSSVTLFCVAMTAQNQQVNLPAPTFPVIASNGSSVPTSTSSSASSLLLNRQRVWPRCATHVAIAYHIHYCQRYRMVQQLQQHANTGLYILMTLPLSHDPTWEARLLKHRSTLRRAQLTALQLQLQQHQQAQQSSQQHT